MNQVYGFILFDISEQEIRENEDMRNLGGHSDLVRNQKPSHRFINHIHEYKEVEPETNVSISQTRKDIFNEGMFIGLILIEKIDLGLLH